MVVDRREAFAPAHGVDLAAKVKSGGKGSIKIVRLNVDADTGKRTDNEIHEAVWDNQNDLYVVGKGFAPGVEVVLNFDSLNTQSYMTRISAQTSDTGDFRVIPPLFPHAGSWRVTAYVPQEEVKNKATDHKRVLEMVDQIDWTIKAHRV